MTLDIQRDPTDSSTTERALRAIRDLRARLATLEARQTEPIAIIGMGCRFPGAADLQAFWDMLVAGTDPLGEVPAGRWDIDAYYNPSPQAPGKTVTRAGGYLPDLDRFDAAFFGIAPREAPFIDPRQRLVLETAWEALEDAGIPAKSLARSRTSVVVGTLTNDYNQLITVDPRWVSANTGTGTSNSIIANRVSYFLDLKGPSLTVDTACAGSLLAIHLACQTLRNGEANLALCGGVAVNLVPAPDICFSRMGALSPGGRCRAFDRHSDGMVRSEGAGMIVLKPLSQALADRDRIYAVIRGSATNHDGRSNGIAAPNGRAQEALLQEAYEKTGISPSRVQYVEAHGTGTVLGDQIEIQALGNVLATGRPADRPCMIGSVKSNIGHTESAAGVAGVIKTALALRHRTLPGNLHLSEPHPALSDVSFPLDVPTKTGPFPLPDETIVAGVSSFSFGGANVHLVIEEAPEVETAADEPTTDKDIFILPLSAGSSEALRDLATAYRAFLAEAAGPPLRDICYTASLRRQHHDHRIALVGRKRADFLSSLDAFLADEDSAGLVRGSSLDEEHPAKLAFVFSGQGSHWLGMGRDLYQHEAVFREAIQRCEPHFRAQAGWSLIEELLAAPEDARLDATDVVQPLIFAVQIGLAEVLKSWNVIPSAVCGQSMGEVAAACIAGALNLGEAVKVIVARSKLLLKKRGAGATAVVGLPAAQVNGELSALTTEVSVAGVTSFTSCIISGAAGPLTTYLQDLQRRDVFCRLLENVDVPAHSPAMDDLRPQLVECLAGLTVQDTTVPFVSTVTVLSEPGHMLDESYWGRNLREPFRVAEALAKLAQGGFNLFLEVSPHPVVVGAVRQCLSHLGRTGATFGALTREGDALLELRRIAAQLYVHGYPLTWGAFHSEGGRCVSLPAYPWQREHYWVDQIAAAFPSSRTAPTEGHPLLGTRLRVAQMEIHVWERTLDSYSLPWLRDHAIRSTAILPGAAYLEMALSAAHEALDWTCATIASANFERMLLFAEAEARQIQVILTPVDRESARIEIHSRLADAGGDWTLHAHVVVHRAAPEAPGPVPLEGLHCADIHEIALPEFYANLGQAGLEYGPAFRGLVSLRTTDCVADAAIALPGQVEPEGRYILHPALLDAAFQSVASISAKSKHLDAVYLPHAVKDMRVLRRVPSRVHCRAVLAPEAVPGAQMLDASLILYDSDGVPVATVGCLTFKRLDEVEPATTWSLEGSLYHLRWEPLPALTAAPSCASATPWLIIGDDAGFGGALVASLEAHGETGVLLSAWADRAEACRVLAEQVWRGVVFLPALDGAASGGGSAGDAVQAFCNGALTLVQTLAARSTQMETPVWFVTRGAVACGSEQEEPSILQSPLWGFGRVLAAEHPDLWGGLVDLDPEGSIDETDRLVRELLSPGDDRQIAHRGEERRAARLVRAPLATAQGLSLSLRQDSAYVITGGLVGLGLETARWMARQGARRLILMGRTELPPRSAWSSLNPEGPAGPRVAAIRELEALGATVQSVTLDVGDEEQLAAFFDNYRRDCLPPIRGIVHSAGLIRDGLLLNLRPEDFETVMRPKVHGSWALHHLTQDMPLDFFVMYSSASAIFGQTGQANYAAANAFQDALGWLRARQGLPATVINWGPWNEAGLFARLGLSDRAGLSGVGGLRPEQGLQIFERATVSGATQTIALNADWCKVPASSFISALQANRSHSGVSEGVQELSLLDLLLLDPDSRMNFLKGRVQHIVSTVLRFDAARLDQRKPLTALGMDSIMAVELRNQIRRQFQVSLSMVDLFTGSITKLSDKIDMSLTSNEDLAKMLEEIENLPANEVEALLDVERTVV